MGKTTKGRRKQRLGVLPCPDSGGKCVRDSCSDLLMEVLLRIFSLLAYSVVDCYTPAAPPVGAGATVGAMLKV